MPAPAWLESHDVGLKPTVQDAREFFGVPPDPDARLDTNINRKRRHWSGKKRAQKPSPEAEKRIDGALKLVNFLADYVKRGLDEPIDLDELNEVFKHKPETTVGELHELWKILEELLASGNLDEALKVANDARTRWKSEALAHGAFAWVAAQASRSMDEPSERMRRDGLESAEFAVQNGEENGDTFWALITLQLDLGRSQEALATLERADRETPGGLNSAMSMRYVEALVGVGDVSAAELRAVAAITEAPEDLTLRSTVAFSLIAAMRTSLLPIQDSDGLKRYQHVAAVAAWCAVGAPEAEDAVRPYRMWSVVADNRMYSGDVAMRAFIAVASGFLLLPVMNRARSKPQWQILHEGPDSVGEEVFTEVALGAVSRTVHLGIANKLDWWGEFVKAHPELKEPTKG